MKHTFFICLCFLQWMNSMMYYNNGVISKKTSEITIHISIASILSEIFENILRQQRNSSSLKKLNCMKSSTILYITEQQRIADEQYRAKVLNTTWFVQSDVFSSSAIWYEWKWDSIENRFRCSNKSQWNVSRWVKKIMN